MSTMLRCANCQQENLPSALFCGHCGQSLTTKCQFCGKENPLNTKFCQQCGNELGKATSGLTYADAMAWRDVFRGIHPGWVLWDKLFEKYHWDFLKAKGFPTDPDDRLEPWVFGCPLGMPPFVPTNIGVANGKDTKHWEIGGGHQFGFGKVPMIIATRCRMGLFFPGKNMAYVWPYTDFQKYELSGNNVWAYVPGKTIRIDFNAPSVGLFDFAMMHVNDPIVQGTTVLKAQAKHENKATFMEIINQFFAAIVAVK